MKTKMKNIVLTNIPLDNDTEEESALEGLFLFVCSHCDEEVMEVADCMKDAAKTHVANIHNGEKFIIEAVTEDNEIQETEVVVDDTPEEEVFTCAGHTKSGNSCSRTVDNQGDFCYQHTPVVVEEVEAEEEVVVVEETQPAPEPVANPVEAFDSAFARIMNTLGGFVEDAKAHEDEMMSYGQMVRGKEDQIDNLREIAEELGNMAPVPAVVSKIEYINKAIEELALLIVDMKMSPLFAEYRKVEDILSEREQRAKQIRERAEATEKKVFSERNAKMETAETQKTIFENILYGRMWLPSEKYGKEPLIKNAWYRANGYLTEAGVSWKERKSFGAYAASMDGLSILSVVFDQIFAQYVTFDDEFFTAEDAFRQFTSVFEKVHYRFFSQRKKVDDEGNVVSNWGLKDAAKEFWGNESNPEAIRMVAGSSKVERFMKQNNLKASTLANVKGGDALLKMRIEAAQKDDPNAEEPAS